MRSIILSASQSRWLRERAPKFWFVQRTASRFMPGEKFDEALSAARVLQGQGIGTLFSHLGENITDPVEAEKVTDHYLNVLDRISALGLPAEISIKLTHLGLDLSPELCYGNLRKLVERARVNDVVWIDMEASNYVDLTLELFRRARLIYPNVGVCLQACLYRTAKDLASLLPYGPAIRLVKGAYKEPPDRAFPRKKDVDENFFTLTKELLSANAHHRDARTAIATHDLGLIRRTIEFAASSGLAKRSFEFQMLYGIQRAEQQRLAREGYKSMALINYGEYWFPWFMRRLAERPANVLFVLRNLFK